MTEISEYLKKAEESLGRAEEDWREYLQAYENYYEAAKLSRKKSHRAKAEEILNEIEEWAEKLEEKPLQDWVRVQRGKLYLETGKVRTGIKKLKEANAEWIIGEYLLEKAEKSRWKRKRPKKRAARYLEKLMPYRAAKLYEELGKYERAFENYEKGFGYSDALRLIDEEKVRLKGEEKEKKKAELHLKKYYLTQKPEDGEKAAKLFTRIKEFRKAAEVYENLGEWKRAAKLYEFSGKWNKAVELYEKSRDWISAHRILSGKRIEDENTLREIAKIGRLAVAQAKFETGEVKEAGEEFERIYREFEYPEALRSAALSYFAGEDYKKVIEICNENPEILDPKERLHILAEAIDNTPDDISQEELDRATEQLQDTAIRLFRKEKAPAILQTANGALIGKGYLQAYKTRINLAVAYIEEIAPELAKEKNPERKIGILSGLENYKDAIISMCEELIDKEDVNPRERSWAENIKRWIEQDYVPIKEIGRGGQAEVYLVWNTQEALGAVRAMKYLGNETLHEAETLEKLAHDYINKFYQSLRKEYLFKRGDNFTVKRGVWIVTDYVEGKTLEEFLEENPSSKEKIEIAYKLSQALLYAHWKENIVHRDIKPSNIMIKKSERGLDPVIIDFGIANRKGITGTDKYMAPEQIDENSHAAPPEDIYAFGCVLYKMFTGKSPFEDEIEELRSSRINTGATAVVGENRDETRALPEREYYNRLREIKTDKNLLGRKLEEFKKACPFPELHEIVWSCLQPDPLERKGMKEIKNELEELYKKLNPDTESL